MEVTQPVSRGPSIAKALEESQKPSKLPRLTYTEALPRFMVLGDRSGWTFREWERHKK